MRDTFSDTFFPGLSTIHSRLRYFLFVQWCCELASHEPTEDGILAALHRYEVQLIKTLTPLGSREGVIGIEKQADLARMPSEIYWTGLRLLHTMRGSGSRAQWARRVIRDRNRARETPLGDGQVSAANTGFDAERPGMPAGFPAKAGLNFALTKTEAGFLRRRLADACVDQTGSARRHNLMAAFQRHKQRLGSIELWEHPQVGSLEAQTRDLVLLARSFSHVMLGAALLYQRTVAHLVSRDRGSDELYGSHSEIFARWCRTLESQDIKRVNDHIDKILQLAHLTHHRIDDATLPFVREWTKHCMRGEKLISDRSAVTLVSAREQSLKSGLGTSRISSEKARARWSGNIAQPMDYRWGVARTYLNDLANAP